MRQVVTSLVLSSTLSMPLWAIPADDYLYLKSAMDSQITPDGVAYVVLQEGVVPCTFIQTEDQGVRLALTIAVDPDQHQDDRSRAISQLSRLALILHSEDEVTRVIGLAPNEWSYADKDSIGFILQLGDVDRLPEVMETLATVVRHSTGLSIQCAKRELLLQYDEFPERQEQMAPLIEQITDLEIIQAADSIFDIRKMQIVAWGNQKPEHLEELVSEYFSFEEPRLIESSDHGGRCFAEISEPAPATSSEPASAAAVEGEEFSRWQVVSECASMFWEFGLKELGSHYELLKLRVSPWAPTEEGLKLNAPVVADSSGKSKLVILAPGMGGKVSTMLRIAEGIREKCPDVTIATLQLEQGTEEGSIPTGAFTRLLDASGSDVEAVVVGHSLGAITGAAAACQDARITHLFSLDGRLVNSPEENGYPWFSSDVCGLLDAKVDVEKLNRSGRLTTFSGARSGLVPAASSAVATEERRFVVEGKAHLGVCFDQGVISHIANHVESWASSSS